MPGLLEASWLVTTAVRVTFAWPGVERVEAVSVVVVANSV